MSDERWDFPRQVSFLLFLHFTACCVCQIEHLSRLVSWAFSPAACDFMGCVFRGVVWLILNNIGTSDSKETAQYVWAADIVVCGGLIGVGQSIGPAGWIWTRFSFLLYLCSSCIYFLLHSSLPQAEKWFVKFFAGIPTDTNGNGACGSPGGVRARRKAARRVTRDGENRFHSGNFFHPIQFTFTELFSSMFQIFN